MRSVKLKFALIFIFLNIIMPEAYASNISKYYPSLNFNIQQYNEMVHSNETIICSDNDDNNSIFKYDIFINFEFYNIKNFRDIMNRIKDIITESKGVEVKHTPNYDLLQKINFNFAAQEKFHLSIHPDDMEKAWEIFAKHIFSHDKLPPFVFKVSNLKECESKIKKFKKHIVYLNKKGISNESAQIKHVYDAIESVKRLCNGNQITLYPRIKLENLTNSNFSLKDGSAKLSEEEIAEINAILKLIVDDFISNDIRPGSISETDVMLKAPYLTGRINYDDEGKYVSSNLFIKDKELFLKKIKGQENLPLLKSLKEE